MIRQRRLDLSAISIEWGGGLGLSRYLVLEEEKNEIVVDKVFIS